MSSSARLPSQVRILTKTSPAQRQVLKNIAAVLEASGSGLQNIVKMNIYLTKMENFAAMNEAYDEVFVWESKPVSIYLPRSFLPSGLLLTTVPGSHLCRCSRASFWD